VRASTRCPARSGPGRRPRRRPAGQHGDHVAARLRRRRRWPAATGDGDRAGERTPDGTGDRFDEGEESN
jgi:hypothetical protein